MEKEKESKTAAASEEMIQLILNCIAAEGSIPDSLAFAKYVLVDMKLESFIFLI